MTSSREKECYRNEYGLVDYKSNLSNFMKVEVGFQMTRLVRQIGYGGFSTEGQ